MLHRLHIRNYLLIEELDLDLGEGLTIITGETGSGKSILVDALGLVMGDRVGGDALRDPGKRCVIELEAGIDGLGLEDWFTANELPHELRTILRRQLEPGGRSRAFINDTPTRLEQLRELAARLVHVHSQHHTLLLGNARFQLGLVDHLAGQQAAVRAHGDHYRTWRALHTALVGLREEEARAQGELDYLRFQLDELDEAHLVAGEHQGLEERMATADNAEELILALRGVESGISGEQGVLDPLVRLRQSITRAARVDARVTGLRERLEGVRIELQDIAAEAGNLAASVALDPAEAARLRERLDLLLRLQQKHRVGSDAELVTIREDLRERTGRIASMAGRIAALEAEETALRDKLAASGRALSKARTKAMKPLAAAVEDLLHGLGMPHAVFRFSHSVSEEPGPLGIDDVRALFSANKDRPPAPLDKVASGGELGRVMLALISLAAGSQDLPTVIFDEIDTGVSGETADRVGALMARMGAERQVLAITHLPQIAGKARHHLHVDKSTSRGRVRTSISPLHGERRVEAIARMLSGRQLTEAAMENARTLLEG